MSNPSRPPELQVIRNLEKIRNLPAGTVQTLGPVLKAFEFRVTSYYAGLIDWSDPSDPLRQIVLPDVCEVDSTLDFDASDEQASTRVRGLQHKYAPTALLLVNDVCSSYCRFCFRKRFTLATSDEHHIRSQGAESEKETTFDITPGLDYIRQHPEIDNVLITGGDPLMLSVGRLESIIARVKSISHVKTVRIGTKVPAFDPDSISDKVLSMLRQMCSDECQIYLMVQFNHHRELTSRACAKLEAILAHRLVLCNQTPLLRGINDSADEMVLLHRRLAELGVAPYYVFHCRPTTGNERFLLSLQEGLAIVNEARARLSGLAKRFRYVGSHATGKIEIVGVIGSDLILRYHEARDACDENRLISWPACRPVSWFDEVLAAPSSIPTLAL